MKRTKFAIYGICVLLLTVIQSTVLDYAKVFNIKPNLLLVFIVSVALVRGNFEGAIVGFFCGLAQDVATGRVLGFYSLLGLYLGLITGSVNRRLYKENFFVAVFFTFLATLVYEYVVYALSMISTGQLMFFLPFRLNILPESAYNVIAAVFIFPLVVRISHVFESSIKAARKY